MSTSTVLAILVAQLGANDFAARERASVALVRLGTDAHLHLWIIERSKDAESSTRARAILMKWSDANAPSLAAAHGPMPWILDLGQHYLALARKQVGVQGPPLWKDYSLATRLLVEDLYRQRVPRHRIQQTIDMLTDAQRIWIDAHGHRFTPPILDLPR